MTAKSVFAILVSKVFHVWKEYDVDIWLVKLSKGRTLLYEKFIPFSAFRVLDYDK